MIKALQKNQVLHELRIDNQRHIFGQNIEGEFVKYLRHNETLCRFGYQFGNAGHRMTCSNYMTRYSAFPNVLAFFFRTKASRLQ